MGNCKRGKIIFEEYFNGYTSDSLHDIRSAGKSITLALIGIAIEEGYVTSESQTIIDDFKADYGMEHLSSEKEKIQIKHLLTMSAGWACDDWDEDSPGNTMHFPGLPDDFGFILHLPMVRSNGETFSYCSGGANLLGEIIRRKS
ncbi:MAG: serine hydrolase domain-containing protein [Algoriphagus sp.]|uniref:serine hydrolase domain-containing protein n=1 Tax=Algoriphagus sp. TaxID=1872435 RepID=UPI003297FE12